MPKPIFIVGIPRSGTTWLANILCRHSKIVGVQSEPFGIHESAFFTHIETFFGNLKDDNNFNNFIDTFSITNFFKLTGIKKDLFYKVRPTNYTQFFRLLMNTFAKEKNADYWLDKTPGNSLYLNKISKYFKDAKFIGIKRNIMDSTKSAFRRIYLKNEIIRKLFLIKRVLLHRKYAKHLERFNSRSNRMLLIDYDTLKNNKKMVILKICRFLDLNFELELLKQKYKPNTSFSNFNNKKEREDLLTSSEKKIIKLFDSICKFLPYIFYRLYYYFQVNIREKEFPSAFWDNY